MPTVDIGDLIILGYYVAAIAVGFVFKRPRVCVYVSLGLACITCVILFKMRIYLELGGLAQTLPFAAVPWLIARRRRKRVAPLEG